MTAGSDFAEEGVKRGLAIALLVAWSVFLAAAAWHADGWGTDNRLERWVGQLAEDPGYVLLSERFGGDEVVLLRVDGVAAPLEHSWTNALGPRLVALPAVEAIVDVAHLPERTRDALATALDLVAEGRVDFLLAIEKSARPSARAALAGRLEALETEARAAGLRMRAAGHPLVSTALDAEARRVERSFTPLLVLVALVGMAVFLRSPRLALVALLPAAWASALARAVAREVIGPSDLILVAAGPLVFVLILAGALHLVVRFQDLRERGLAAPAAARAALADKLAASLLAAFTTALGFGVFLTSELVSVARLGGLVAGAVLVCTPCTLLGLRVLLAGLPLGRARNRGHGPRTWRRLAIRARRQRAPLVVLALGLLGWGVAAALSLRTETNGVHYFPAGHPVREHFLALEREGAALSSFDLLVRADDAGPANAVPRLAPILLRIAGVSAVFGPDALVAEDAGALERLEALAVLQVARRTDADGAWWRWTVRYPTQESGPTLELRERVEAAARVAVPGRELYVAGSVALMLATQDALVTTLASSLTLTLLVTTLLFLLTVRTPRELLIALFVNTLPIAAAVVGAALLAFPLDGATVMVAAVVLGLAVDNTFHVLHAARRESTTRARLRAFGKVGGAAAVSSLALALGFASLGLSGFAPTARFGLLCALGAGVAWAGDLLLLPALWIRSPDSGDRAPQRRSPRVQ
jgi:predicted RND superfamily exporter protein